MAVGIGLRLVRKAQANKVKTTAAGTVARAQAQRKLRQIEAARQINRFRLLLGENIQQLAVQSFQTKPSYSQGPGVSFTIDRRWKNTLSEYSRVSGKTVAAATVRRAAGITRQMWLEVGKDSGIRTEQQQRAEQKQNILRQKVKFPKRGPGYTLAGHILLKRGGQNPLPGDVKDGWARRLIPKRIRFKAGGPSHHARLRQAAEQAIDNAGKINRKASAFFRVSLAGAMADAIRRGKRKFEIPQSSLQSKPITFWNNKKKVFKPGGKIGFGIAQGKKFQPQVRMEVNGAVAEKHGESILRKAISKDIQDMDAFIEKEFRKRGFL